MNFCFTIAVLLIAACLFVPSYSVEPKPGICPEDFNTLLPVPPCDDDSDCPGDEKCCMFDYGSGCVPPDPPVLGCPPHKGFGSCIEACFDGCKNGQICCSTGCGQECKTPVPV